MAIEDHPKFDEWKAKLEFLLQAKQAFRDGSASKGDVDAAFDAYVAIADEV